MKILLMAPSLGLGGAERIVAFLANTWAERGEDVTLAILNGPDAPRHYDIRSEVNLEFLDIYRSSGNAIKRCMDIWKRHGAIRRVVTRCNPDVVVSHIDTANIRVLLSTFGLDVPIVVAEHTDPLHYDIGGLWRTLRMLAYRRCHGLVVLTEAMKRYFARFVSDSRIHVFYNPIEFPKIVPSDAGRKKEIIYLGRLSCEKGVSDLLQGFAGTRRDGWRLLVAGDGPDRETLEAEATALEIADDVCFLGRIDDVYGVLETASIFVLPSHFEGLPNALCEAMSMGLPSLATRTSGAMAVIEDGVNGLLVPVGDHAAMSRKLELLMDDDGLRQRLGRESLKIRDKVHPESVMDAWDHLVRQVVQEGKN